MAYCFWKKVLAVSVLAGTALFASCDFGFDGDSFQNKAGAYFKEMTSTATIESYKISPDNAPTDKNGNICLSYEDTYTVEFTLRNPQHYSFISGRNLNFSLAQSGLPGSELVSIKQDSSDTTKLRMTFPADFLMQNAAGANISPRISMMHPISFASFGAYDKLKLSSDSPPPKVSGALTMQTTETPSRWVLCFNLPTKSMVKAYHSDIVSVSVNGKTFDATVSDDGSISVSGGSDISNTAPSNIVANQNTGLSFTADENCVYFLTGDEADEKEKIYTVVVTDKAGLSSSLAVSTRGFKLGAPDSYAKADTQFANKFKIYDPADPDGTKNSVEQDEDESVYVTIKAEPKTASFDYTDPVSGETKHVEAYDYDKGDACVMWEVYRDEACSSFVSAGKINGLQGTISIPAGTSFVRAFVRKPLYSDSEVIKWKCRAVFTRFYVSEEGDDNAEGSKKLPFRTIQRAVDAFIDGINNHDYDADSACDICVMTDLTTPASYDYGLNNDCLIDVSDTTLSAATVKVSGYGGTRTVNAAQGDTAVRKFVNAAVGKTVIQNLNLTGGGSNVSYSNLLTVASGAELNLNSSKIYQNAFTVAANNSFFYVIKSEGTLVANDSQIQDNTLDNPSDRSNVKFWALFQYGGSTALTNTEISGHKPISGHTDGVVTAVDANENITVDFAMTGGSITGNTGVAFSTSGSNTSNVTLTGVEINGNDAASDAAVGINTSPTILDGCTITGNTGVAGVRIGAASFASLTLKGKNTIYDNKMSDGTQRDLYLPYGKTITIGGNITDSKIGVYTPFDGAGAVLPTEDAPVPFTSGYATPAYANPAMPGNVLIAQNGYSVTAMPSGTSAGEAAFGVSSGGMYGAEDYTITLGGSAIVAEPGKEKTATIAVSATRKEPVGDPTDLWYNSADKKFYLASAHTQKAADDWTVEWKAELVSGSAPIYPDLTVGASDGGITVTVPAIAHETSFTLRVTATFMGVSVEKNYEYKVKNSFVSVAGASFDGSSAVPNSEVFISGRRLNIKSLIVCDHEVTQKEWLDVTGKALSAQAGTSAILTDGDEIPMYYVNWFDALVYCNKKSAADGLTPCYTISGSTNPDSWGDVPTSASDPTFAAYKAVACDWNANGWRLPTEAEWEYLARGGNLSSTGQTKYSGSDNANAVSWHRGNTPASGQPGCGPQAVRTKAPNALDLYDMTGNVYEWCWDCYSSSVAADVPITGPVVDTNDRNARGGAWNTDATFLTFLELKTRTFTSMLNRANNYGLRVVRSEDTATSYVLPTYCGSKEPGEALAVGDIVFDDGSATPYAAGLTLSDAQKARAIAVIYYTGYGSAGSYNLGQKTLGVGIKEWKYNQSLSLNGSSNSTTPKWSINAPESSGGSATGNGADKIIVPNDHDTIEAHKKNGLLTLALMKENVAEYNVAAGIIPDSPVFYWAEHYGEGSDKIAGNTALPSPYNSGWYLPGQDELMAIHANRATINSALGAIGPSAVQIAVGSTENDCLYHSATGSGEIYAANLYSGTGYSTSWRGKACSVRAVRLFP